MRSSPVFSCRLCESPAATQILDLGEQPLANAFVDPASELPAPDRVPHPLELVMCDACHLLQLGQLVPRSELFDNYLWTTGTSSTARAHAREFAARLGPPGESAFLVEIASNDGTFLHAFQEAGWRVHGVEPSNLADEATAAGLPSTRAYFDEASAVAVRDAHGPAGVIVARNVIGHVEDLRGLLAGIELLLAADGHLVVETPYAAFLRTQLQYDTVFHEHCSYLTLHALATALGSIGLSIVEVDFVDLNGGSFLCRATRARSSVIDPFLRLEAQLGLNTHAGWADYPLAVRRQRDELRRLLESKLDGRIFGYGAAAKTMVMLNYCDIGTQEVEAFADANERKRGLLCPGVGIPVVSVDELLSAAPGHVLIGPWNLRSEIVSSLRARGYAGGFIVPLPIPSVAY